MSKVYDVTEPMRLKQLLATLDRYLAEHERTRPDKPTLQKAKIIELAAVRNEHA
jgi:hypothetical protein